MYFESIYEPKSLIAQIKIIMGLENISHSFGIIKETTVRRNANHLLLYKTKNGFLEALYPLS